MKMRKGGIMILLAVGGWLAAGCASQEVADRKGLSSNEHYELAKGIMGKKDYLKAINEFKAILRRFPDSPVGDQVLLDLAKAYYHNKDYTDAVYELRRFMRDYPESPLIEDGQYYLSLCFLKQSRGYALDQEETKIAMDELKAYLNEYPQGTYRAEVAEAIASCREKLAEKDYNNARLYYKRKLYEATIIYCLEVIEKYPDTSWKLEAVKLLGLCDLKLKDTL